MGRAVQNLNQQFQPPRGGGPAAQAAQAAARANATSAAMAAAVAACSPLRPALGNATCAAGGCQPAQVCVSTVGDQTLPTPALCNATVKVGPNSISCLVRKSKSPRVMSSGRSRTPPFRVINSARRPPALQALPAPSLAGQCLLGNSTICQDGSAPVCRNGSFPTTGESPTPTHCSSTALPSDLPSQEPLFVALPRSPAGVRAVVNGTVRAAAVRGQKFATHGNSTARNATSAAIRAQVQSLVDNIRANLNQTLNGTALNITVAPRDIGLVASAQPPAPAPAAALTLRLGCRRPRGPH